MKILCYLLFLISLLTIACNDDYNVEYQKGYPNRIAGNWIAYDIEILLEKYQMLFDTIQNFDLEKQDQLEKFINLVKLKNVSERYNLTSALDPNRNGFVIFDNINNNGNRVRSSYLENRFITQFSPQLDLINKKYNKVEYISISGQLIRNEKDSDDILIFVVGLYNINKTIQKSLLTIAFRKTGFEDVDYQSLIE